MFFFFSSRRRHTRCGRDWSSDVCSSDLPAGHRIRLALSTGYWPMIWPAPERATLLISGGTLELPVRAPRATDSLLKPLPGPESAPPEKPTIIRRSDLRIERIDRLGLELGTHDDSKLDV